MEVTVGVDVGIDVDDGVDVDVDIDGAGDGCDVIILYTPVGGGVGESDEGDSDGESVGGRDDMNDGSCDGDEDDITMVVG